MLTKIRTRVPVPKHRFRILGPAYFGGTKSSRNIREHIAAYSPAQAMLLVAERLRNRFGTSVYAGECQIVDLGEIRARPKKRPPNPNQLTLLATPAPHPPG